MLMNPMVMMMGVTLLIMVAPPTQECYTAEPCLALGRGSGRPQLGPGVRCDACAGRDALRRPCRSLRCPR